jgi:hypothetical protein
VVQISFRLHQGFHPHNYVKYNTFVTFCAWLVPRSLASPFLSFPFFSFHIIFLLTSTGQTGEPIFMVDGSNDAFCTQVNAFSGFHGKKFDLRGSVTPKNRQKVGVVYDFPAKLEESIQTHISVKSRHIDIKFELYVETEKYTLDFGKRSPIIKSKMAAAAIMKNFKLK